MGILVYPCREENRKTVKLLYEKFKNKGFQVYGVSLDEHKEKWIDAIKKDSITWLQVCTLTKAVSTELIQAYNFTSLPATLLLNKDKKIIAINKRGESLERFVEKFIDEKNR